MSIINDTIASNVLDGVINVHGTRRNLDSSTDERRCFVLTPEDIESYTSQFKYNSGEVSDGKIINEHHQCGELYNCRRPTGCSSGKFADA